MKMEKGVYAIEFLEKVSCEVFDAKKQEAVVSQTHYETWALGDKLEITVIADHGSYINFRLANGGLVFGLNKNDFKIVE